MSGSTQKGDGTTVTQLDPQIKADWLSEFQNAQNVAAGLNKTPVPQQQVAAQNADQTAANILLNQQIANGVPNNTVAKGVSAAYDVSNYKPQQIDPSQINGRGVEYLTGNATTAGNAADAQKVTYDRSAVSNVNDPTLLGVNLKKYENPFQQDVIDSTMADWQHGLDLQKNSDKADAAAADAFGNSRYGVVKANTNDAADRTLASTLAGLNTQNFTQAAQNATNDLNRGVTADQSNQQADLTVFGQNSAQKQQTELANAAAQNQRQEYNATNKQSMDLANQQAGNAARMQTAANDQQARVLNSQQDLAAQSANQGAGLTANSQALGAANTLGQLGGQQQQIGLNNVGALNAQGASIQGQSQNVLNAAYNNAQAQRNAPTQALQVAESPFQITLPSTAQGGTSNSNSSGKGVGL